MNSTDRTNLNTIVSAEGFLVGQTYSVSSTYRNSVHYHIEWDGAAAEYVATARDVRDNSAQLGTARTLRFTRQSVR
jgi:hypothetical protein